MPRICSRPRAFWRLALGELDERSVLEDRAHGTVLAGGGPLTPGRQLTRDRPRLRIQLVDPGQALPRGLRITLVGGGLQTPALLARPLQAAVSPSGGAGAHR